MEYNRRALLTGQVKASGFVDENGGDHVLVTIFQRGAADGLNAIVPYGDDNYQQHRPNIAIPEPGMAGGAFDLDNFFGMNPNMPGFYDLYQSGKLAVIHACGVPHGSRSHFDAQGLVERAILNKTGPSTGWLGRHFALRPPPQVAANSSFRLVALSGNVPVALYGAEEPLAMASISDFGFDQDILNSGYPDLLGDLFRDGIALSGTAQTALSALDELRDANPVQYAADNGAIYPGTDLGNKMLQVAQLVKSDLPVEAICVDSNGWDHHESIQVYLPQSLTELDEAVSAFYRDLGEEQMNNVTVLIYTEFGRRVKENASLGVDHGTGAVAYLLGGRVNGGQVAGDWPGLALDDLAKGEDLAISTDLRTVFAEILSKRFNATDLSDVLPGFSGPTNLNLLLST